MLTQADYANLFFSHDEFLDIYSPPDRGVIDEIRKAFADKQDRSAS